MCGDSGGALVLLLIVCNFQLNFFQSANRQIGRFVIYAIRKYK
jgi:hypothetical protein